MLYRFLHDRYRAAILHALTRPAIVPLRINLFEIIGQDPSPWLYIGELRTKPVANYQPTDLHYIGGEAR